MWSLSALKCCIDCKLNPQLTEEVHLVHCIRDDIINKYGNMMIVRSNEYSQGHSGDVVITGQTKNEKTREAKNKRWAILGFRAVRIILEMFWSGSLGWVGLYCLFWLVYWAQRQPMDHNTNVKMPNLYNHHLPPLWSPIHFVNSHKRVEFLNPYQRRTHKRAVKDFLNSILASQRMERCPQRNSWHKLM